MLKYLQSNLWKVFFAMWVVVGINSSWAQVNYVSWDFTTNAASGTYASDPTQQTAVRTSALTSPTLTNVTVAGATGTSAGATYHRTVSWSVAQTATKYLEFTITLASGQTFRDQSLSLATVASVSSASNSASNYKVRYFYGTSTIADGTGAGAAVTGVGTGATLGTATIPAPGNTTSTKLTVRYEVYGSANTSSNFQIRSIALTGASAPIVSTSPTINASGTLSAVNTTYGTASATPTSFTASGSNLTANLVITAPAGFEVSTSSGSGYGSSVSLTPSSGTVSSTVIYVRLAATTVVGTYSGNIALTSTDATTVNVATASSTVSTRTLTITGISGVSRVYDATNTAAVTGTATLSGVVNGDAITLGGTPIYTFANKTVATNKTITVSGYAISGVKASNYTLTQPTGLSASITTKSLTVTGITTTDKTYDSTTTATLTGGTLNGVISGDTVNIGTGTFAQANAGTNIAVTVNLTGTDSGNYTLTQPGLTANINKANQTITFGALSPTDTSVSTITLTGTASSGLTVTYVSSNTAVATISGTTVTIVGAGTTTITASQSGTTNYNAATPVAQDLQVTLAPTNLAAWNLYTGGGNGTQVTATATDIHTQLVTGSGVLTRGATAPGSSGNNSFRSNGFQNDGINVANTDYFETKLTVKSGYKLSLANINARFVGTSSFTQSPGVTTQFAYSIDGTTFTLIGSSNVTVGDVVMPTVTTTGVTALQNIPPGTTLTIRFYASGQTTTGGFGFSSPSNGVFGLQFKGFVDVITDTTWENNAWTYEAPNAAVNATIIGNYDTGTSGGFISKSLTVSSTGSVHVTANTTLTVANALNNQATASSFIVDDNGALVQTNNVANSGSITVHKNSSALYRQDYTLWSAPTSGTQTLASFAPGTLDTRFYEYDAKDSGSGYTEAYYHVDPATTTFAPAHSYLIRMPNGSSATNYNGGTGTLVIDGQFTGTPNNGTITRNLNMQANKFTATGNPYPSPIGVSEFFSANSSVIDAGSGIYLWRKKNSGTTGSYATVSNASYTFNTSNGTATGGQENAGYFAGASSTWRIAPGQGFIVKTNSNATGTPQLTFNNTMRKAAPGSGGQSFFRVGAGTATVSRYWISIANSAGDAGQFTVAYLDDATNGLDYGYDAVRLEESNMLSAYTIAENKSLTIQARPEFDNTDVVVTGYTAPAAGTYTLSLNNSEGTFAQGQLIYIKDNSQNVVRELSANNSYSFSTEAGTFNDRFEIVYTNQVLNTDTPANTANVAIYRDKTGIVANAGANLINGIEIYDIQGRRLYANSKVNAANYAVTNLTAAHEVLIVKVATDKGTVSKKIIF
jgi:trimeric autotransporter adhesin